ncbi:MAG: hypothetical protein ACPG31_13220 [Planctomycetota bacterium]
MNLLTLTLLCSPDAMASDLAMTAPLVALQEPEASAEQEGEKEKPKKKKFARLKSPDKKKVAAAMRLIEKNEEEEDVAEGVAQLIAIGEAAIPSCMDAVKRMDGVGMLEPLWQVLDTLLLEDDLDLAWGLLKKKSPDVLRVYLVRRYADSKLEEVEVFLKEQLANENPDLAYEAARGLALRGDASVVAVIEQQVAQFWLEDADRLRADFAGVERGALSAELLPLLQRKHTKEKLAALRMVELFGTAEQCKLMLPFLSESDTTMRLAAINVCRVILDGEAPLKRPSMTEIIERAEAWKAKL